MNSVCPYPLPAAPLLPLTLHPRLVFLSLFQVLMLRLQSDLAHLLLAASTSRLNSLPPLLWSPSAALVVVLAAKGYPGKYQANTPILNLPVAGGNGGGEEVVVFHAGTAWDEQKGCFVSAGGRVLGVTALGATVADAQQAAYEVVDTIDWPEGFCRRDIGWRAVEREKKAVDAA